MFLVKLSVVAFDLLELKSFVISKKASTVELVLENPVSSAISVFKIYTSEGTPATSERYSINNV